MNMLIHNVVIFTCDEQNRVLQDHAVAVKENRISEIDKESKLLNKHASFKKIDGGGRLLMPGLINAHNHFYSTFARGVALTQSPKNFHEILKMLWWKLDSALDSDAVYYSALVPAITAVKRGVTAVIDHHASPNAVDGSLDRIEEALSQVGMRGILCYEISDRDGKEVARQGLVENRRYAEKCREARMKNPDHLYDGMVGLHASFTIDDNTLQKAVELSNSLPRGCHIHLLEDEVDRRITAEQYGAKIVERLFKAGVLGNHTIVAHGIYLQQEEMDMLAHSGTMLVHNPQSNMNNAVGRANIFSLMEQGILTGIGTDGMSAGIIPDVRTANLLHKHDLKDSNVGWQEIQQMTLKNNPEIYNRLTHQPVGRIEKDFLADMILVDYYPPTPLTGENFWGHFLYGIADAPVDTTIINGEIVMENGELPGIDEAKVGEEARNVAEGVWKRFKGAK